MYNIEARLSGVGDMLVELCGELDLSSLEDLLEALNSSAERFEAPVVDLSGVTFLDLNCARELAAASHLHQRRLTLRNPSWQVAATIEACGLGAWFRFGPGPGCADRWIFSETGG